MPLDPDDPTSRRRREVGVFAREAWLALQQTLARFRDVKEYRDRAALADTQRACDDALHALERLQRALRLLSREIGDRPSLVRQSAVSMPPRESTY